MDIRGHNRTAWDRLVRAGDRWTVPVSSGEVAAARRGEWQIFLTPSKPVPGHWFPPMEGLSVLCLASGGGQQGPILAAAGAEVAVFDNSPGQLEQDRYAAQRDSLTITTVEGDMADLSVFPDGSFGLVVNPVSNLFVPDVPPVWREAFRVLRPGGVLLAGFNNPAVYLFDYELADRSGILQVRYALPYSDLMSLTEEEKQRRIAGKEPIEFSHTLEDQIGGQLDAGFVLTGFYEDRYGEDDVLDGDDPLTHYMDIFIATRSARPLETGTADE